MRVDSVWGERQQSTNGIRSYYNNEIKDNDDDDETARGK